jgi:cyclic nucleotide gated channel, plant
MVSIQRADNCWREACNRLAGCDLKSLYCMGSAFGNNTFLEKECPTDDTDNVVDPIFGIYLPVITNVSESTNLFEKLFYCFWWGLQSLRLVKN